MTLKTRLIKWLYRDGDTHKLSAVLFTASLKDPEILFDLLCKDKDNPLWDVVDSIHGNELNNSWFKHAKHCNKDFNTLKAIVKCTHSDSSTP